MQSYVIFETETGAIVSVAEAPEGQLPPKGPMEGNPSLSVRHGSADPDRDRIKWGRRVSKTKTDLKRQENEQSLFKLRAERQQLLAASDWTQMPDADLSATERADWAVYRQALRDLTKTTIDPTSPVWPVPPTKGA